MIVRFEATFPDAAWNSGRAPKKPYRSSGSAHYGEAHRKIVHLAPSTSKKKNKKKCRGCVRGGGTDSCFGRGKTQLKPPNNKPTMKQKKRKI
jgi:hypothetical protein